MNTKSIWVRYSFAWVTFGFFLFSLIGHWIFGWFAFVGEQVSHGEAPEAGAFLVEMLRDTLENWQSEFLQLLWQVGGLAFLLHVGSPQSREGNDRMEAKLDEILKRVAPGEGDAIIDELDEAYAGSRTPPHGRQKAERRD